MRNLVLLVLCHGAVAGCADPQPIEALEVLNFGQCRGLEAGLTVVAYEDLPAIRGTVFADPDTRAGSGSDPAAATAPAAPSTATLLIALSRGPQPTPGYGFTLQAVTGLGTTASIQVAWRAPPADAILAQVITHPCLVVALPSGGVHQVEATDQTGAVIGRVTQP